MSPAESHGFPKTGRWGISAAFRAEGCSAARTGLVFSGPIPSLLSQDHRRESLSRQSTSRRQSHGKCKPTDARHRTDSGRRLRTLSVHVPIPISSGGTHALASVLDAGARGRVPSGTATVASSSRSRSRPRWPRARPTCSCSARARPRIASDPPLIVPMEEIASGVERDALEEFENGGHPGLPACPARRSPAAARALSLRALGAEGRRRG